VSLGCGCDRAGAASRLFPPEHPNAASAQSGLLHVLHRDPHQFGHAQNRWTLASLLDSCSWLHLRTLGGLCQLLERLNISYKRGRDYIHSPDPYYQGKLDLIADCLQRVRNDPERYVLVYEDELTYYRQPTLAAAFEARGQRQPLARRSPARNSWFRVIAGLNAMTGQVTYRQHGKIDVPTLGHFFAWLRADYPQAELIYVVVDNWPVHFHPDVLAYLQPQRFPWPPYVPPHWTPSRKPTYTNLPIELLCLPTYASWCNPIEKLWRWLKQRELHLHRLSEDWAALKQRVAEMLDQFKAGSPELLRYTGLSLG
jgi:DDE superfamily endonuclease